MATQSRQIAQLENGLVTAFVDYDDATLRISAVRVINNGTAALYVEVRRTSDGLIYGQRFGPGETFIPVPTNGQNRIDFIDNGRGQWSGVSWMWMYPYP